MSFRSLASSLNRFNVQNKIEKNSIWPVLLEKELTGLGHLRNCTDPSTWDSKNRENINNKKKSCSNATFTFTVGDSVSTVRNRIGISQQNFPLLT